MLHMLNTVERCRDYQTGQDNVNRAVTVISDFRFPRQQPVYNSVYSDQKRKALTAKDSYDSIQEVHSRGRGNLLQSVRDSAQCGIGTRGVLISTRGAADTDRADSLVVHSNRNAGRRVGSATTHQKRT